MATTAKASQPYHHGGLRDAAVTAAVARLRAGQTDLPTVRELAAELGVTHRALYRHFSDKAALKAAVAGEGFALLAVRMTAQTPATPRRVMQAYVAFAFAESALYGLMFAQGSNELMGAPQSRRVLTIVRDVFAAHNPKATDAEVRDRVVSAWGMAHGLYELWRVGALTVTEPARAASFIVGRLAAAALI
ncbi:MAG: TetR/AcrR family transcriptional regulator [Hyphomonadaceae bacterium]|nr:TetR/AcrR family transcriptional regulator [Hyphomonadaceae bacterium]